MEDLTIRAPEIRSDRKKGPEKPKTGPILLFSWGANYQRERTTDDSNALWTDGTGKGEGTIKGNRKNKKDSCLPNGRGR